MGPRQRGFIISVRRKANFPSIKRCLLKRANATQRFNLLSAAAAVEIGSRAITVNNASNVSPGNGWPFKDKISSRFMVMLAAAMQSTLRIHT
jgi:hypothetical protein